MVQLNMDGCALCRSSLRADCGRVYGTATQFVILIVFVIPGVVYQTVRARLAGEAPQNRDTTNKFLRALAASVVLASVYMIILGPMLVAALGGNGHDTRQWLTNHARRTGLLALTLLFAVPASAATVAARRWCIGKRIATWRSRGPLASDDPVGGSGIAGRLNGLLTWITERSESRAGLRDDPTPTAWDWAVDHGAGPRGFVRVLGPDGTWKGGAFGDGSYFHDLSGATRGVRRAGMASRRDRTVRR